MHNAYLGIGGNLGNRLGNLIEAVRRLNHPPQLRVVSASSVYESKPVGPVGQPDYLNAVLHVATSLHPHDLLTECLRIETTLGRVRAQRWGPRTLDLDVLLYDDLEIVDLALTLPHPRMLERNFVLTPLTEIAPHLVLAGTSLQEHAAMLGSVGLRKFGGPEWAALPIGAPRDADSGS